MNKKIIAIAIATAMAAPVAMADVKVSGRVGGHLTLNPKGTSSYQVDTAKAGRDFSDDGASRIQFDGTSGSTYARIAIDVRNLMGGQTGGKGRDIYAGTKFGNSSLQFGRMATAAKNSEKDPYITTFLQVRNTTAEAATAKNFGSSSFVGSLVQFATKANGVSFKVQMDPTDNSQTSANAGHFALAVAGKSAGINWWASYNNGAAKGAGTATDANETNAKVGASMKMGNMKMTLNVTDAQYSNKNKETATTFWVDFNLGGGLSADVGYASNSDKGTWTRLAVAKKLSKGTKAYAGAVLTQAKGATQNTEIGVGMIVKF